MDLIFGIHSIGEAIKNSARSGLKLFATDDGLVDLKKKTELPKGWEDRVEIVLKSGHALQEEAKKLCAQEDFQFQRVPSQVFLCADSLPQRDLAFLYDLIEKPGCRLLVLDQVTDVHNLAAILRTASFYNISAVVVSKKGGVRLSPGFFRIASGAAEHLPLVNVASLPRGLSQLMERGVTLVGLSEHAKGLPEKFNEGPLGLVLGAEETGLSHAVMRVLEHCYALESQGQIKSLNVSVAAAVSMEKFFGQNSVLA